MTVIKMNASLKHAFLLWILFIPIAVYAQSQRIIPLSSELYSDMDSLYLFEGEAPPSEARPWTETEARAIFTALSDEGAPDALYQRTAALVNTKPRFSLGSLARFDANLDAAFEGYAHTNSKDYYLEADWANNSVSRKPALKVTFSGDVSSFFSITTDLAYAWDRVSQKDYIVESSRLPNGLGAVLPSSALADGKGDGVTVPLTSWFYSRKIVSNIAPSWGMSQDWPQRADFTLGGKHWDFTLGRDRLVWGGGITGNFVFDSNNEYTDFFRFSAFTDRFKYEWINAFYMTPVSGHIDTDSFKTLMAHRMEFRFLKSLSAAVSENVMYNGSSLSSRFLNPAFIFHDLYNRTLFNAIAQIELYWTIAPRWQTYAECVLDQINAPWEHDGQVPAWGLLAGGKYVMPLSLGVVNFSLEGVYTTSLLYRRDKVDFLRVDTSVTTGTLGMLELGYIGYPYGGDVIAGRFGADWEIPGRASLDASFFAMLHGAMNMFASHNANGDNDGKPNLSISTPSGSADKQEWTLLFSVKGNYTLPHTPSWCRVHFWAEADYVARHNKFALGLDNEWMIHVYHIPGWSNDLQCTLGAGIGF
jgi:hypothetical protein